MQRAEKRYLNLRSLAGYAAKDLGHLCLEVHVQDPVRFIHH